MSHPSRTRAQNQEARRRRHHLRIEAVQVLEDRQLLTPYIPIVSPEVEFTAAPAPVGNNFLGTINVVAGEALETSAAPFVSVSQLTPISQFGGNSVRIEAGPGGDFGKGIYAITRGINTGSQPVTTEGRPGVIYRVDPATGDATLFFDLNTVVDQITPGDSASTSAGVETGLVNWYDIAFDAEGYFDGLPSMFVSTVDSSNPLKNTIYRIAPDGTFLGLFAQFTDGQQTGNLNRRPSAILVPPPEQQQFLRGLVVGDGNRNPSFTALFFDANAFSPGQDLVGPTLPRGVFRTDLNLGPEVGLTSANRNYLSRVYSAFTDFGTRGIPGFSPAIPGFSGVQGVNGELLIGAGTPPVAFSENPDAESAITTPFRRFQDTAFDQYGFFSYGTTVAPGPVGGLPTVGEPIFAGSLFVSDLATGLGFSISPVDPLPTDPIIIPIQGPGPVGVAPNPVTGVIEPILVNGNTTGGNLGGRIIRILPDGSVNVFAEGFNTSGRQDSGSFIESSLSITFSADGTALYASDNDGIWQFKSTLSLAGSSTGQLTGLNDLRSLGVPFQGEDTAVAVLDTGVDALTPPLRGRVAEGRNVLTRGRGDDDLSANLNGHGTLVAGVISQFVPQTTIQPVNLFSPLLLQPGAIGDAPITTNQAIFDALKFTAENPFVRDPVRPGQLNRVVTAALGFGTIETFDAEGTAFRAFPQITIAFKNQLHRFRNLGITPVAAAGQLGVPFGLDENLFGELAGDVNGMTLPAVLNEVVSVTGTYSFPFEQGPTSPPTDPVSTVLGRSFGPATLFPDPGDFTLPGELPLITDGDILIFQDKLLASANRSYLTDFAAPAVNVPTFRRTDAAFGPDHLVFDEGGTSLSAGIVAGSFTLMSSALDFYSELANKGFTAQSYLTQPVGARVLNFGPHTLRNLEVYNNPDAINSILQWTAVPVADADIPGSSVVLPPMSQGRPTEFREFARIDVGNALAAVEGAVALPYLIATGGLEMIDSNNNGLITAQELQRFIDIAPASGLAEIGAMARLLGGTARPTGEVPEQGTQNFVTSVITQDTAPLGLTARLEQPDRFDVLQRRFNYFDYAANGQLDGVISIEQFHVLAHTLLPSPDSFVVVDRQRSSGSGFQLDPTATRNTADLQRILPTYAFVPRNIVARFRNFSPNRFGVNRGFNSLTDISSLNYTLFDQPQQRQAVQERRQGRRGNTPAPQQTPTPPTQNVADTSSVNQTGRATSPTESRPVDPRAVDSLLAREEILRRDDPAVTNPRNQENQILQTLREMARANGSGTGSPELAGSIVSEPDSEAVAISDSESKVEVETSSVPVTDVLKTQDSPSQQAGLGNSATPALNLAAARFQTLSAVQNSTNRHVENAPLLSERNHNITEQLLDNRKNISRNTALQMRSDQSESVMDKVRNFADGIF